MRWADSVDYRDTLEEIEMEGGLRGGRDRAVRFMVEACSRMSLPDELKESLEVAARQLRKEASDDVVEAARVSCWQSIAGQDSDLSDKRVAATRAVICALYPRDQDDHLFDTLDAFKDFAFAAGLPSEDLLEGLRRAFQVAAQPAVAADGASPRR
jgi:hypothetical protein